MLQPTELPARPITIKASFGQEKRRFEEDEAKNTLYESILIKVSSLFNIVDFQISYQDVIITNSQQLQELIQQYRTSDILHITIVNEGSTCTMTPRREHTSRKKSNSSDGGDSSLNDEEEEYEVDEELAGDEEDECDHEVSSAELDELDDDDDDMSDEPSSLTRTHHSTQTPPISPITCSTSFANSNRMHISPDHDKLLHDPMLSIRHVSPVRKVETPVYPMKHKIRLLKFRYETDKKKLQIDYKRELIRLRLEHSKPNTKLYIKLRQQLEEVDQRQEELMVEQEKKLKLLEMKFEKEQQHLEEKRKKKANIDDVILTSRVSWPSSIIRVFIHGDDMLANAKPLNHYAKRNRDTGEQALIDSVYAFHKRMLGVIVTVIIFNDTRYVMQKKGTAEQNRHFIVSSGRMQHKSADALFIEQSRNIGDRETCLFVTSKSELRQKLKFVECKCVQPTNFLQFMFTLLDDEGRDLRQWLEEEYVIIDTQSADNSSI